MKATIIIGAGPAGLTAAYELIKRGYDVTVIEEDIRVGGISKTVCFDGNRMDLGGHRFFSKDEHVMTWWRSFLPLQGRASYDDLILNRQASLEKNGPDPEKTDRVMLVRNRVSRIFYNKNFFDYPISMKMSTIRNMGFRTTIQAGFSYLFSVAHKLPEKNLENFYINRFGRKLYSMFFESYTEKLWGRHPRKISADWGAQRVKGLSIRAVLKDMISKILPKHNTKATETSLIEQFWYPKLGPGELWDLVAHEFIKMGGTLITDACVTKLHFYNNTTIDSVTYVKDNLEYTVTCDKVISSMPLKDLVNAFENIKIPSKMKRIASGLPYRDYVTIGLLLPKLALKNETNIPTLGNIVPDNWMYIQDSGVKMGRIQIFNNWSPYMVENPEHNVWLGLEYFCNEGDDFWNMSEKECAQFALRELKKMGIVNRDVYPCKFHRERVKKAYPAYFDTYKSIDQLILWLNRFDNLYCIGRNGQHRYNNMDHSMVTAFETVDNIVKEKKDKMNIWNVNTEQEYHEEK